MTFHSSIEDFISYRNSVKWETLKDVVVYVDDFIGSGGSVVTALSIEENIVRPEVLSDASSERLYVVTAIVMDNGYSKITQDISGAVILGDLHCKGFDPHKRYLGVISRLKWFEKCAISMENNYLKISL